MGEELEAVDNYIYILMSGSPEISISARRWMKSLENVRMPSYDLAAGCGKCSQSWNT